MKVGFYITTEAQERAMTNYHAGVLGLFDAKARGPVFASVLNEITMTSRSSGDNEVNLTLMHQDQIPWHLAPVSIHSRLCHWCPYGVDDAKNKCNGQCTDEAERQNLENPVRWYFVDTLTAVTWRLTK